MTHNQTWQQVRLICSSGLPPLTIMPILSEAIHSLLPCLSFSFIFTDAQAKPLSYYAENFDENSHKIFSQKGDLLTSHSDDPASFANLFELPADYGNLFNPPKQFYQSSTYLNLFAPNGLHHVIDMTVSHRNSPLAIVGIFREKLGLKTSSKSGFNAKEIATLPLLYSHIKHLSLSKSSIESHANLLDNSHSRTFGLTSDDHILTNNLSDYGDQNTTSSTSASITVNESGDILFASDSAIALLKQGLSVKNRYLLDYQHNMQPLVKFLCHSFRRTHSDISSPPVYYLSVPDGVLIIRAYQMQALTSAKGMPKCYSIHIELVQPLRLKILRQLKKHELSPKSMMVGWLIATNLTNTEICQQLRIQPSTLRSYLKDLYTRFDVSSHQQLKQKLTLH